MSNLTLKQAIGHFQDACTTTLALSEKTARAYGYDLAQFEDFVSDKALREVSAGDITEYLRSLEKLQGLKSATIRRKIMTLKTFFGLFVDRGDLVQNPMEKVDYRSDGPKERPRILNSADIVRLLEHVNTEVDRYASMLRPGCGRRVRLFAENAVRDRAIVELLFSTAMRIGELTELDLEDMDLEAGQVHVRGKGHRDRRLAVTSKVTLEALRSYAEIRKATTSECTSFFLNRFGGRLSIFAVENMFERVRRASGIRRRVTPHALRHTMATMLLNNGMEIERIRDILGHSSVVTTHIYDELAPRRQKRVLERLQREDRFEVGLATVDPKLAELDEEGDATFS